MYLQSNLKYLMNNQQYTHYRYLYFICKLIKSEVKNKFFIKSEKCIALLTRERERTENSPNIHLCIIYETFVQKIRRLIFVGRLLRRQPNITFETTIF